MIISFHFFILFYFSFFFLSLFLTDEMNKTTKTALKIQCFDSSYSLRCLDVLHVHLLKCRINDKSNQNKMKYTEVLH